MAGMEATAAAAAQHPSILVGVAILAVLVVAFAVVPAFVLNRGGRS